MSQPVSRVSAFFIFLECLVEIKSVKEPQCEGVYLTPLIKNGSMSEARELSIVSEDFLLGIHSHSGFITVDEDLQSHLFFWYFPHGKSLRLPWIIWLNGGPGDSSMIGLFDQIGPIRIENGIIKKRNQTWAKDYSLLFIDSPVGAGFSHTKNSSGYATNVDQVSRQLHVFLMQFLELFPEQREAPLYIAGEAFASKYVAAFALQIHTHNDIKRPVSLKGISLGNPIIEPQSLMHYSELTRELGLLQDDQLEGLRALENSTVALIAAEKTAEAAYKYKETIEYIKRKTGVSVLNFMKDPEFSFSELEEFFSRVDVRKIVHAGNNRFYLNNLIVYENLMSDIMNSSKLMIEQLLDLYGVMCYHGQLDLLVPYAGAKRVYDQMWWGGREQFLQAQRTRIRHYPDDRVVAFKKMGGNFVEVVLRGCGHDITREDPDAIKFIIDMFVVMFNR